MRKLVWVILFAVWLTLFGCGTDNPTDGDVDQDNATDGDNETIDGDDESVEDEAETTDGDDESVEDEAEIADGDGELVEDEAEVADGDRESVEDEAEVADGDGELVEDEAEIADGDGELVESEVETSTKGSISGKALLNNFDDHTGIDILLILGDAIVRQTETDNNGEYEFLDVDPDTYTVTASWGDNTTEYIATVEVEVSVKQLSIVDDLHLTPTGNIEGTAVLANAATGNEGIELYLPGYSYTARTNDTGKYLMSRVPVGTYRICANIEAYDKECLDNIVVTAGQTTIVSTFNLTESASTYYTSLTGNITLLEETNHSGITVSLDGTSLSTTTDQNGDYYLTNIPQGQYNIVFTSPTESGFENGLTIYNYNFYAFINVELPDYTLSYGRNIEEPQTNTSVNDQNSFYIADTAYIQVGNLYYKYNKTSGEISLLPFQGSIMEISADNNYILYMDGDLGLYVLPLNGGTETFIADFDVTGHYKITSDSSKVLYLEPGDTIYSVPITGGTPVALSDTYTTSFILSPDSSRVIVKRSDGLYSMTTDGENGAYIGGGFKQIEITPNSTYVVYINLAKNLYSALMSDGTPTLLADSANSFKISPNSATVVYLSGASIYSQSTTGGTATTLASDINYYEITADSNYVIYMNNSNELYQISIAGGSATLLASDVTNHDISPDSAYIIYQNSSLDLYSVPITGGTPVLLDNNIEAKEITPDSNHVIYVTNSLDIYSVPITGGTPVLLGSNIRYNSNYDFSNISSDSTWITFKTNDYLIYRVNIDGSNKQCITSLAHCNNNIWYRNYYYPAFNDFSTIFYVSYTQTETNYYSNETYRFNVAEFE